jgi:hypothetical protein
MDPQFYAFLSSLWGVFNSNFWAALAGAFAGAVAASRFAARQEMRDDLERKVNEINAAISIAYSACEAYITHKEGLIDRLANAYRSEMTTYNESKPAQQTGARDISLSLMESTVLVVQCSALQELVFKIPSAAVIIRLVSILAHRNSVLNSCMSQRNELIRTMNLMDQSDRLALYFGLARKDGFVDKTYPYLINALSELSSDCIFFSWLICELLASEGLKIRDDKNWLPSVVPVSFEESIAAGLIPNPHSYSGWHNLAPRWQELATPLYDKYSSPVRGN